MIGLSKKIFAKGRLAAGVVTAISLVALSAQAESAINVDIKAKSVDAALLELARKSGVQIMFSPDLTNNLNTKDVSGSYTVPEALDKILQGTALSYETNDGKVFVVKEKKHTEGGGEDEKVEEVVVTGSLIRGTQPTSPSVTIDRAEIDRMGVYSVDDILRRLPQNFSSLNRATSRNGNSVESTTSYVPDSLGSSGANLRGLGVGSTLVLIDGRRTATSPLAENGFVNLASIPASSIERIDVILDGASATYGADAIGGVINIITRKDYVGAETNARMEKGKNGGDLFSLSQMFGTSWDSGRITAVINTDETKGISSLKADYYTDDHRSRGGLDNRDVMSSRGSTPGSVGTSPYESGALGALPLGHNGVDWVTSDLSLGNARIAADQALRQLDSTPETRSYGITLNVDQEITDTISAFGRLVYNKNENEAANIPSGRFYISENNPYNNVDVDNDGNIDPVWVNYAFINEVGSGGMQKDLSTTEQERIDLVVGFNADLPFRDWALETEGQFSREESTSVDYKYDRNNQWVRNDRGEYLNSLTGEYERRAPINNRVLTEFGRWIENELNPFGDGSVQGDLSAIAPTASFHENPVSEEVNFRVKADGSLFELPGGELRAAIGGEYRQQEKDYSGSTRRIVNTDFSQPDNIGPDSVIKPEQSITSIFTEFSVPLIGADNALPGVESLLMTVSARYDSYDIPDADFGNGTKYTNVSPKVGFMWNPVNELTVRLNWSEAFRAPTWNDLITDVDIADESEPLGFGNSIEVDDPVLNETYRVRTRRGGNPDLKPEIAEITTIGFDWVPSMFDGVSLYLNYNKTDYQDRISTLSFSPYRTREEQLLFLNQAKLAPRGEDGRIEYLNHTPINLATDLSKTLDFGIIYDFMTDFGDFTTRLSGTKVLDRVEQKLAGSPIKNLEATEDGPDTWKINASVDWRKDNYGISLLAYYSSSWTQISTGGERDKFSKYTAYDPKAVDSYTTVDLTGFYNLEESGWSFQAGVRNLFDTDFPFVQTEYGAPYSQARVDPNGRVVYLNVRKSFEF